MKLTIEHLKGYLGTGLELIRENKSIPNDFHIMEGLSKTNVFTQDSGLALISIDRLKPLLYPLSSLTEFREDLGFVPRDRLIFGRNYFCKDGFLNENAEKSSVTILPYTEIQKLQEWHIDYQNLIENDLAIDKRTV